MLTAPQEVDGTFEPALCRGPFNSCGVSAWLQDGLLAHLREKEFAVL